MQLTATLLCVIAIFSQNVLICKGYNHAGYSKSIVRDRVFTSSFYDANNFNLERGETVGTLSNFGSRRLQSTSLSMSSGDDIGKVKYFVDQLRATIHQIIFIPSIVCLHDTDAFTENEGVFHHFNKHVHMSFIFSSAPLLQH